MNTDRYKVIRCVCPHDCPDSCSMLVTVDCDSGRAVSVQGDPSHPITAGFLCSKVSRYLDFVYGSERVLYPHRRVGPRGSRSSFERIGWNDALASIGERFQRIIETEGAEAIQPFSSTGTLGMLGYWGMSDRFWHALGSARIARTICNAADYAAGVLTYGPTGGANIEAIPSMDLVLLWGTNILSTGTHITPFLRKARARGATIIAIDPRVTRTTAFADRHVQPRPGTDHALALGMMNAIAKADLHDQAFLSRHVEGWEGFLSGELHRYSPETVSEITGVPIAEIMLLAEEFGRTKRSFIRLNYGLQRHDNGGMMSRCIRLLPAVTGAWRSGGGVCSGTLEETWAVDLQALQRPDFLAGREPRTLNQVQLGRALCNEELDPPVRALYVWNSDPINSLPDSNSVREGLCRDSLFTVVHDVVWTDTTLHADLVLPATTQLEQTDFHAAYGHYYVGLSQQAIQPIGESKSNQETFRLLARVMGLEDPAFLESDEDMIRRLLEATARINPLYEGLDLQELAEKGWTRTAVESPDRPGPNSGRWPTPTGRIELYSRSLEKQGCPWPAYTSEKEGLGSLEGMHARYPLQVISSAMHFYIGSTFQHVPSLRRWVPQQEFELNPFDAADREISDGDLCRLFNDRGETLGVARVIEGLLKGVVGAQKQFTSSLTPGGLNVNALTSQETSDIGDGPVFYSVMAEIEKV
ncbi:MAG: molybdopterin-dependent oxidoreductase [Actinobacteria bacterium]|nr:molybdopterin-dependent oxidoreductase [Actinomycetota bacterium]